MIKMPLQQQKVLIGNKVERRRADYCAGSVQTWPVYAAETILGFGKAPRAINRHGSPSIKQKNTSNSPPALISGNWIRLKTLARPVPRSLPGFRCH